MYAAANVQGLQDLVETLQSAPGPEARFGAFTQTMATLGIDQVNYGFFDPAAASAAEADVLYLSTMQRQWLEYYADRALHRTDPHVVKVRQGNLLPYRWGDRAVKALADPDQVGTAEETREAGIHSALCVPLAGPYDPRRPVAGMTLGSTLPETELMQITARIDGFLVALAHIFHDLSFSGLRQKKLGIKDLSPREHDVLCYLARGLRQSQIANRMGLSRATIEMHLAKARRKLKAATLPEAVARALTLQMIAL